MKIKERARETSTKSEKNEVRIGFDELHESVDDVITALGPTVSHSARHHRLSRST